MRPRCEVRGLGLILAVLIIGQSIASRADVPQELVGSGVSSVVRGTPSFNDSTFFWASFPDCGGGPPPGRAAGGAAGSTSAPVFFYRESLAVASPRAIFAINPLRPAGTCNPYRLLSNIVTDGTYLYYIDNQGADGHKSLWRRPRLANPDDPSQFLADIIPELDDAELVVFGTTVFAILRAGGFHVLVEYDKNTGALLNGSVEQLSSDLSNLQYDGRFLYWINAGALRRDDTTNGERVTVLDGPIHTYFVEGYDKQCGPDVCLESALVVYDKDNGLSEIESISGDVFPLYTSPVAQAQVTNITRDATHYFFIERRPVGDTFQREDRFYRLGVGDTLPDLIYGPVNNGGPGFDSFTSDFTWLYFRDRAQQKFLRLADNAAAIPVHDLQGTGLEITQGLQNTANALRLMENKRTIVRFYVKSAIPTEDVEGVTAALSGSNSQGFLGTLQPVNTMGKLMTVRANPSRQNLDQSFQFELPSFWTTGGPLSISAAVNPYGRVVEDNTQNNSAALTATFTPSPRLLVVYYNFSYDLPAGTRNTPVVDDVVASRRRMRRLYPLGEPGDAFESPGLHTVVLDFVDNGLAPEVARTAMDCVSRYPTASDRNMCASDYVHARMMTLRQASNLAPDTVTYGNIAQAVAPMGLSYFTRGYTSGQISSGPSTDPNYASHEVGHALGRAHPAYGIDCGHSLDDNNYPYPLSLIEDATKDPATRFAGLDFPDTLPGTMTFLDAKSNFDTMSYCTPNWISDYTFNGMYAYLISDARPHAALLLGRAAAVPGDWLVVSGKLQPAAGTGGFVMVERTTSVMDATAPVPGGFTLELRNGAGGLVASHGFTANPVEDQPGHRAFDLAVPFVPGTALLRVIEDATGHTLATHAVSANAPLIADVQVPGAPGQVDGVVTVTWNASDPDGDALHFDVFASRDGGQTYRPIVLGIDAMSVDLDTAMLGGGTNQLRVVASDGAQTAYAESASFTVPRRPPRVVITSPVDGYHADWGQLISFQAEVDDLQDESIPDGQIIWSGSQNGILASGRWVQFDSLPVGTNVIAVTATNSLGASASATVTVVVGDQLAAAGPTLSVAPQTIAWHVADNDQTTQVSTLNIDNAGSGTLQFDVSSDAPWFLVDGAPNVSGAVAPRIFTLTAAPTLVPAGTTSSASLTLQSLADPNDRVVVAVQLSRGDVFDHSGAEPPTMCAGDCNGDRVVSINEIVSGVNIALDTAELGACPAFDTDANGKVSINELIAAVAAALRGC